MRKTVVWTTGLALLAGCANMSQEQRSSAEAAGIGGVGSALLCRLMGGRTETCVAVGAGVGAVAGIAAYNYAGRLQQQRQALAGRENDLDAQLAYVREVNQSTETLNARLKEQADGVAGELRQGRLSEAQLARRREDLDRQIAVANDDVARGNQALAEIRQLRARPAARESQELDRQIAQLERSLAEAQRNTTALASLRQRI